ncbi:MAG: LPS export ABC transporter permease LptG [Legionellales bacterium]|nr:MAG: LPS export ABC transporter permease LptG [Legionellales bacterium]
MKILDRYIATRVLVMILLVAFALLGLDIVFTLVQELSAMGKGGYDFATVLTVVLLQMPTKIYFMFAWSGLIGSLLALGIFAKHNELIVMQTAAVSVSRIAIAVVKAAIIVTLLAAIVGEVIAPLTDKLAQRIRATAISNGTAIGTLYGNWFRVNNDFVHVGMITPDNILKNIKIYKFNADRTLQQIKHARVASKNSENIWQLRDVQIVTIHAAKTTQTTKKILELTELVNVDLLREVRVKHLDRISFVSLLRAIKYRAANNLSTVAYDIAVWSKLCKPLAIVVMILLGVPFVFGPLRGTTIGVKILVGILVGFSFHTINALFAPIAVVYSVPAYMAASMPILLFAGVGLWLLRRV